MSVFSHPQLHCQHVQKQQLQAFWQQQMQAFWQQQMQEIEQVNGANCCGIVSIICCFWFCISLASLVSDGLFFRFRGRGFVSPCAQSSKIISCH
jgi:hypothetical protein